MRFEVEVYRIVACENCRLLFTHPLPSPDELRSLYPDSYYGERSSRGLTWDAFRQPLHRWVLRHRWRSLSDLRPGTLLDVGCGDGDFLAHARQRDWQVKGCDDSPAAVDRARSQDLDVTQGGVEALDLPPMSVDAVTLWHVLEHLPEPGATLERLHTLLRPEGVLVVEVPDADSWTFRLCGKSWFSLDVPRHLQHFTQTTLEFLLNQHGFDVEAVYRWHPLDCVLAAMSFLDRAGVLKRGEHYFVDRFRSASWGRKGLFLLLGGPFLVVSIPYSLIHGPMARRGETLRIRARPRKAEPS